METSISEIHHGFESSKLTCHSLVEQYLDRIKAYDQQGPTINAMLYVNPKAPDEADALDKEIKDKQIKPGKRGTKLGTPAQAARVHSGGAEGQLRHRRYADHRRIAGAQGHAGVEGCVRGGAAT